jgi:quercetin dioxygenase-like cupin family protein
MARPPATVLLIVLNAAVLAAQAPTLPAGFTVTRVLDNATISAVRLKLAPGAKEQPHTHPSSMLVIMLTASEMEMQNGEKHTKGLRKVGEIEFINSGVSHHAANAGATPLEALVVTLKPDRVRGGTAPPATAAQPGVTRKPLIDNQDLAVTRLEYEAEVREPVHTHPYDLLIVPISPARLDMQLGHKKQVGRYVAGDAIFVPRGTAHAVANVGTASFRILGIRIK